MKVDGYKAYHESLTSNNAGTTALESTIVVLPSIFCLCFLAGFQALEWIPTDASHRKFAAFFSEFFCTIMPCILSFTVWSDYVMYFILAMIICSLFMAMKKHTSINNKTLCTLFAGIFERKALKAICAYQLSPKPRSYITNFRAITNILTVLSILAVDFHIFPRRFAKTETFGFGVMDLGVGLFIVANALVAPETRLVKAVSIPVLKTAIQCIPLIVLGAGRLIMTNQVDYQKHVTEYGQHWNFFFTLAATKLISSIILKFVQQSTNAFVLLFASLSASYEIVLHLGLQAWILSDAPRLDPISANREGLASIVGYVALYFGGIALARIIIACDGCNVTSNIGLAKVLTLIAAILWSVTALCDYFWGVSRRLSNMGYILWILSFTATVIALLLAVEAYMIVLKVVGLKKPDENILFVPKLFEAINKNGLLFFLLGNVLTGLFNMKVKTFTLNPVTSFVVITTYMLLNCAVVKILYFKNITLKI